MYHIYDYLKASAEKYPEKTAFADVKTEITYRELLVKVNHAASVLVKRVKRGQPVAVFMDKSVEAVTAFLTIARAGGFYVMLDIRQPAARLEQILHTLQPECILTDAAGERKKGLLPGMYETIPFETMLGDRGDESLLLQREGQYCDTDPLYAIFTSGSTGTPKGVVVSHRSVIDFIGCFTDIFHISDRDVIGNQAPLDFDVSVKDMYSTLKCGATMQLIPKQFFSFPTKLLDFLCERNVTTLIWAVSALCMVTTLKGFSYKIPEHIDKVLFSGEAMPIKHLRMWKEAIPDAMYVNLYGPTEITCNCTYHIVREADYEEETLPIGIPFPNEKVFLLDEQNQKVEAADQKGEICVAGTALSLGYYNNPQQTQKAFVQNPLHSAYPELIYRTGDLGFYREDGLLVFSGRKDFQIKHMGHRIELGEIEHAMESLEGIDRAVCIFDEKKNRIMGFYQGEPDKKAVNKALGKLLPSFMIPNVLEKKEAFPLTKNGKIDRKELMAEYES